MGSGSGGGLSAAMWPLPAQQPPGTRGTSQTRKDRAGRARAEGAGPPGSEGSRPRTSPSRARTGQSRGVAGEPSGSLEHSAHTFQPVSPLPPRCSGSAVTGAEVPEDAGGEVSVTGQGQPVLRRTEPGAHREGRGGLGTVSLGHGGVGWGLWLPWPRTQPASRWPSWKFTGSASHLPECEKHSKT